MNFILQNEPAMKGVVYTLIITFIPLVLLAQSSFELTSGYGFTGVNLDKLVEKDEVRGTDLVDWNQGNVGFSGQYIFASSNQLGFGAEFMYQHLYWYSVKVPYAGRNIFREYYVNTVRLSSFVRFGKDKPLCLDVGPELNFIDGVSPGLLVSGNYYLPISNMLSIPLKLRMDLFKYIVFTPVISFQLGVRINM